MILLYIFKYLVKLNKYRRPVGKHAMDLRVIIHQKVCFQFLT